MYRLIAFAVYLSVTTTCFAQHDLPQRGSIEEMKALHFLTGDWKGTGWIIRGPGLKDDFVQRERVRPFQGGDVLLFEGEGRMASDTSVVVHDAFAVIGYDRQDARYIMQTFLAGGRTGRPDVSFEGDTFVWQIGENVRYKIRLNDAGQWHEVGHYSRDGGSSWEQFFEMTLDRVGDPR